MRKKINYDILKEKWFVSELNNFQDFLKSEKVDTFSKTKTQGWVKEKQNYIKTKINERKDEIDKKIGDKIVIATERLLNSKILIFETLIKRATIISKEVDEEYYDWACTYELKEILNMIRTEVGEVSEIKKVEWNISWFSISIVESDKKTNFKPL